MKKIIELDKWLFVKINKDFTSSFADNVLPFLRQPYFWAPFYVFFIALAFINFGKRAWMWLITVLTILAATDLVSGKIIKPYFARVRPCNDPEMAENLHMLAAYCGGNGSFTSSHAANHFAMAVFMIITMKNHFSAWRYLFFFWAAIVCYAQVYVGVHYPLDILGGAILGCLAGYIGSHIFLNAKGPL